MSHYEERLEKDLNDIRDRIAALSSRTHQALRNALHSLLSGNHKLAYTTILGDSFINEGMRDIDRLCHHFIARHLPSAGHLRYTSSVIRTSLQLERLGDYAVTIAREGVQLSAPPEGPIARQLEIMSDQAIRMLSQAIEAFNAQNAEQARVSMQLAASMEGIFDGIYADMLNASKASEVKDLLALFVVFNMVKRISDQAKNICEETLFSALGETKSARVHPVLFLDQDNSALSVMAQTIAERNYPDSAHFTSAGQLAAQAIEPALVEFMSGIGFDLSAIQPVSLDASAESLAKYFVIVSLDAPIRHYVDAVPFHTSALEWDVGQIPRDLEGDALKRRYEEIYREISSYVRDLAETLSGREIA